MALGYTYEDTTRCPNCMQKFLIREKDIEDDNELSWLLDGADSWNGKMRKWPVRDAQGDYVKVDIMKMKDTIDNVVPVLEINLRSTGAQVYYTDWKPKEDDPVQDIDTDIITIDDIDEDAYSDEGLQCDDCGEDIIEPVKLHCQFKDCLNVLTQGRRNIGKVEDEYRKDERICEKHYDELCDFLEVPVIDRISALNRENPDPDYESALFRLAVYRLDAVYSHFLGKLTVYDETAKTPWWHIVVTIKMLAEQHAFEKPWDIFEFDIEKSPAYDFAENLD